MLLYHAFGTKGASSDGDGLGVSVDALCWQLDWLFQTFGLAKKVEVLVPLDGSATARRRRCTSASS